MAVDREEHYVLESIRLGRGMMEVVDWGVPYTRLLQHLRGLIARQLLAREADGTVVLTNAGEAELAVAPHASPSARSAADPLASARVPPVDPNVVRLPQDE